jgi:DNA-binding transcriptional regulator GbsR (MarR family)
MTLSLEEKENAKKRARRNSADKLSLLEAEVISLFVQVCRFLRQPRSLGEIYGLLFISPQPLALDDLIYQLGMSKASASMGLKSLRNSGAIKMVYMPGDRRVHYEAVPELRNLASHFLRDQIVSHWNSGAYRLGHITDMVKEMPAADRARVNARVTTLTTWEKKSRKLLPVIFKIFAA